jgi:hypothetical protein
MSVSELTRGVIGWTAMAVAMAALPAAWLAGATGAIGVLSGGTLALLSFRLLAARMAAATSGSAVAAPWTVLAGVRFAAVSGVAAALFVAGWAHPAAWLVGYSALPVAVVLQGLRLARREGGA